MRTVLACLLAVLVSSLTLSAEDKKDEKIDAKNLIGRWESKSFKGESRIVLEFKKDGKVLLIRIDKDGKEDVMEHTYKFNGTGLQITVAAGDSALYLQSTVTKLTDTDLVTVDRPTGIEGRYVRLKDK